MTRMALEDAGWDWARYRRPDVVPDDRRAKLYASKGAPDPRAFGLWPGTERPDPLTVVEDEPENSPDLGVLERFAHPYTVAVLVVAALLAAICGVIAWRLR